MPNRSAKPTRRDKAGYTLIELLLVVSLMGVMAALMLPKFEPTTHEQLQGAAQIVAADMAYARNLAVTNDSQYRVTFSQATNAYVLQHAGTNHLLDVLPTTPYRHADDTPDRQSTYLAELPHIGASAEVVGIKIGSAALVPSGSVEFDSLGGLSSNQPVTIWLACGQDRSRRYLSLSIAPVTGLCTTGQFRAAAP
ncbi:MAG TPA: prepilin-type N-terminal cleavage/methylation domain-containing protein [Pirellulaceae bacterium]|nr:prepilin-type N-terminal cleavage/methylation domain-containing protein [Pirellulaceae bacterium]